MTLGLPLLATTTLVVLAMVRGEEDPAARAFLAVTAAYVVMLVAQVSLFAVEHLDHVSERYMITALPLLVLGLCLWTPRAGPRPAVIAVPVTVAALTALLAPPQSRVGTTSSAHDALTLLPLGSLAGEGDAVFRGGRLALGFGLRGSVPPHSAEISRRDRRSRSPWVSSLLSVHAAREIDRLIAPGARQRLRQLRPASGWTRPAPRPFSCSTPASSPRRRSPASHSGTARPVNLRRLDGVPAQALPQQPVTIRSDGALRGGLRGRGGQRARHVLLPATHALDGERLASSPPTDIAPGYGLWRSRQPLAAGVAYRGLYAGRRLRPCEGRRLPLCTRGARGHLARERKGSPVRLGVNGFPWRTVDVEQGEIWSGGGAFAPARRPAHPVLVRAGERRALRPSPGSSRYRQAPDVFELVVQRNLRLDRVARVVDLGLGDEDLERRIVERLGVVLDRGLPAATRCRPRRREAPAAAPLRTRHLRLPPVRASSRLLGPYRSLGSPVFTRTRADAPAPPLRKRDLDDVEVARHNGVGKGLPRLVDHLVAK